MGRLADFPITARWRPRNPDVIQLYSAPTTNGVKAPIMLEEAGLAYDAHRVEFASNDQNSAAYLSLNPNGRIPAIIDPHGPGDVPLPLFESGAILLYLAEKSGRLLPAGRRWETVKWLSLLMAGLGPMCGQLGYFHQGAGKAIEDPRPKERYRAEVERLLKLLDAALDGRDWIAGEYTIADIAIGATLWNLRDDYRATGIVGWAALGNVPAYLDRFLARPAVRRGLAILAKP